MAGAFTNMCFCTLPHVSVCPFLSLFKPLTVLSIYFCISPHRQYFCDCDAGTLLGDVEGVLKEQDRFAGLYCEFKATSNCKRGGFCVNGGRCVDRRYKEGGFEECDCAGTNFEGTHCEFVKGSRPVGWATAKYGRRSSAMDSGMKSGGKAVLTLFMLGLFGAFAFFVVKKHRNKDEREEIDPNAPTSPTNGEAADESPFSISPTSMKKIRNMFSTRSISRHAPSDLELEADGGVLQDAMKDSQQGLGDAEDEMTNEENGVGAHDDDDDEIDTEDVVDVEII